MRFISYLIDGCEGIGVRTGNGYRGESVEDHGGDLIGIIGKGPQGLRESQKRLAQAKQLPMHAIELLPILPRPNKLICIGLNYADHSAESGFQVPTYPTVFARYMNSLVAHGAPIIRPVVSEQLDYEGELAVIIGKGGRHIGAEAALDHVAGYSIFNDASIRDYQFKSPQWTIGKTFDGTGAFGPEFVTADELPAGAKGLRLQTRLNGKVVQDANTDDLIFGVADLIVILSEAITLAPGDVIVSGTPSGVGLARKPPLWMAPGDVCEVEIDGIGILSNPIAQEAKIKMKTTVEGAD
jgi:2-keto-4-pentenoate hydratase/2-oxohepta-3-ene-1,7-dioic acid hydratase in catechol pathway